MTKVESIERLNTTPLPVVEIDDPRSLDKSLTGGKAASLAELAQIAPVPPAFVVTTDAHRLFIEHNPQLNELVAQLDQLAQTWRQLDENGQDQLESLIHHQASSVRQAIQQSEVPQTLVDQIDAAYQSLSAKYGERDFAVAVRSSDPIEDNANDSFAGQYDTYLNQRGLDQVLEAVKSCYVSQFSDRVISYRNSRDYAHKEAKMAVAVQVMVDASVSGVAFSVDPKTGSPFIAIDASFGLGEAVVAGKVTPDSYLVDPQTKRIVARHLGEKNLMTVYAAEGGTVDVVTAIDEQQHFALPDEQVIGLASDVARVAAHYNRPMDVEFAFDGNFQPWLLQARPETVNSKREQGIIPMKRFAVSSETLKGVATLLNSGKTGSPGVGQGEVVVAATVEEARKLIKNGNILVTDRTDPDWEEMMRKVSGIITNIGGPNCHAAIISRENGIPCLVGTGQATEILGPHQGRMVTLDADRGKVFQGKLRLESSGEDIDVGEILAHPTKTPIGLILSSPETARKMYPLRELESKFIISLLRIEFLLTEIGVHPQALLDFDRRKLRSKRLHDKIGAKILGFESGREYYISKLSEGIAQFAALFPGSAVTVRTTDFKTNEYSGLIGGDKYESSEANPMMGWRGLIRSLAPSNREATLMEMEAIKRARDMGYKNIQIMFPIVRDPAELTGSEALHQAGFKGMYELLTEAGMGRGVDGLNVGIMCEVPANVIRRQDFIDAGIDFMSFGTNDLTQFTLAADRDGNDNIQSIPLYGETNPAVMRMVQAVIKSCKESGVKTGICGQAPSNSPEFVRMIIEAGIDSIGVMPDRYLATYRLVREAEEKIVV